MSYQITATTKDAYDLFHRGSLALAEAEYNGIRIDQEYCERMIANLEKLIESRLKPKLAATELGKAWAKRYGRNMNYGSDDQLRQILYKDLQAEVKVKTKGGKTGQNKVPAVNKKALIKTGREDVKALLEIGSTETNINFLKNILRESQADGYIHPFFHLASYDDDTEGGATSFRGCIAKGTKILIVRNFESDPEGVPIETVREGDLVYCFSDNLKPSIRKVIWAGKTGHRKVVRLHWRAGKRKGYLDLTPEHFVRHISGQYIPASLTAKDYRDLSKVSHKCPRCHVLAAKRSKDKLFFTFSEVYEHRLVYQQLIGELSDSELVHHKNENHMDHDPGNLEKSTLPEHARYHTTKMHKDNPGLKKQISDTIKRKRASGEIRTPEPKRGTDHPDYLNLSKFYCLKALARNGGKLVKTVKYLGMDFGTFKKYLDINQIEIKSISLRYDKHGKYISKHRLLELSKLGRSKVSKILGHNYYKLLKLYELYGIDFQRMWANQFGRFAENNHSIISIEYLDDPVDVYDIQVDEFHNFIANEICVHNSSSHPNFQNNPNRHEGDRRLVRSAIIPREGHRLVGRDYGGIEVCISACNHQDPNMIRYIERGDDMHRDTASMCFMLDPDLCTKKYGEHGKQIRQTGKNAFTFPQFYFQEPENTAQGLWMQMIEMPLVLPNDPEKTVQQHLMDKGIRTYEAFEKHIKEKVCPGFWEGMFPGYWKWRLKRIEEYHKNGYFDMLTGFRVTGVVSKYQLGNFPIQGPAFHCLLWSMTQVVDLWKGQTGWRSKVVGQIHDELTTDEHGNEFHKNQEVIPRIMSEGIRKHWPWIIVPLSVETDATPVDGNWYTKKGVK